VPPITRTKSALFEKNGKERKEPEAMEKQKQELLQFITLLQAFKDKSKLLSVYALLGHEDGAEYSPTDYKRAIARLRARKAKTGDTADGFIQKGVEWLKEHQGSRATA